MLWRRVAAALLAVACAQELGGNETNGTALEVVERDEDAVTMACVTWNMAALCPSPRDCKFLASLRHHSVICVGVQELEDLKPRRAEGHRSVRWTEALRRAFPEKKFYKVADHAAGPVRLAVFVNKAAPVTVRDCAVGDVACGIGNIVRNKGCSAAFLELGVPGGAKGDARRAPVRLCLVAAHLAAHAGKVADRNADYWRIARELAAQAPDAWRGGGGGLGGGGADVLDMSDAGDNSGRAPLLDAADLVVFSGDLNYRLDLPREEAERGAVAGSLADLLAYDQLKNERAKRRAFTGFLEGPIRFAPTYKYDKRSDVYDSSKKMRIPSWTDRVLYTPKGPTPRGKRAAPGLKLTSYDAVASARHSDHRPVVATFRLSPGAPKAPKR